MENPTDTTGNTEARELHTFLKETYPHLFKKPYTPLKIGIHKDLIDRHKEQFSNRRIKLYLAGFTRGQHYLRALADAGANGSRVDLDGNATGKLSKADWIGAMGALGVVLKKKGDVDGAKHYKAEWQRLRKSLPKPEPQPKKQTVLDPATLTEEKRQGIVEPERRQKPKINPTAGRKVLSLKSKTG